MLASIVGLEIAITRLIGKSKLSQNKQKRDVIGVAQALRTHGNDAIADAMLAHVAERVDDTAS